MHNNNIYSPLRSASISLISFLLLFACSLSLHAQRERMQNRPYADYSKYHLGFHVGVHVQDLVIRNSGLSLTPLDGKVLYAEVPTYTPGFSVGVIGDMALSDNLNLRIVPTLHFGDKVYAYSDGKEKIERFTVRSNYLEVPLLLKYSSRRLNNMRPYLIGGIYGSMEMGRKKGQPIYHKAVDYGLQIGLGCNIYLPFFKLCPELRFAFGLPNVVELDRPDLVDDNNIIYTQAIKKAQTRMIMLTFNFE